jgi:hypothetical protein
VKDLNVENIEFVDSPERSVASVITPKGANAAEVEDEEEDEEEEVE